MYYYIELTKIGVRSPQSDYAFVCNAAERQVLATMKLSKQAKKNFAFFHRG